jgi:hypothetical protein
MSHSGILTVARSKLVWIILPLSIAALSAELLPEVKAKIIVIPTLILMIALCILEIHQHLNVKKKLI